MEQTKIIEDIHAFFKEWGAKLLSRSGTIPMLHYALPLAGDARIVEVLLGNLPQSFQLDVTVRDEIAPRSERRLRNSPFVGEVRGILATFDHPAGKGLDLLYVFPLPAQSVKELLTFAMKLATRDTLLVEHILDFENFSAAPSIWVTH